jgi:hypothetical protein
MDHMLRVLLGPDVVDLHVKYDATVRSLRRDIAAHLREPLLAGSFILAAVPAGVVLDDASMLRDAVPPDNAILCILPSSSRRDPAPAGEPLTAGNTPVTLMPLDPRLQPRTLHIVAGESVGTFRTRLNVWVARKRRPGHMQVC